MTLHRSFWFARLLVCALPVLLDGSNDVSLDPDPSCETSGLLRPTNYHIFCVPQEALMGMPTPGWQTRMGIAQDKKASKSYIATLHFSNKCTERSIAYDQ